MPPLNKGTPNTKNRSPYPVNNRQMPRKFSGPDESDPLMIHSVRYFAKDLDRLKNIAKATGIDPGIWLRQCLRALVEAFDRNDSIVVPFVIVPRDQAEKAGLLPPLNEKQNPQPPPPQ